VIASIDAAASALRARAANGMAVGSATVPADPAPVESDVPAEAELPAGAAPAAPGVPVEAEAADQAAPADPEASVEAAGQAKPGSVETDHWSAPTAPARSRRDIVSAPNAPSREQATGSSQRQYPWLRGSLVKLAHDDPETAGRIIAGLLPVQAVIVERPVDYDLTITEVGTFAISVDGDRADVSPIVEPRGRRVAEFHISADALTLAEFIAGVPHKLGRFRGQVRVSGRKRRTKPLKAIRTADLSFAEAARAGARLEPALVFRTFPYVIHPSWSRKHSFTVAQQILGDPPETWYLAVGDGGAMKVLSTRPEGGADATVTMTREAFGHLLRGQPVPPGHRPSLRGDRAAVAELKRWLDRAQGL
jgi:hypothetical protein